MKNSQRVSFKDIEAFLAFLPESELQIVNLLRRIVVDCIPDCQEKLAYNVPFFTDDQESAMCGPVLSLGVVLKKG